MTDPLALAPVILVGVAAGFIGSLFGIGGGAIMTPLLIAAGYPPETAVPASLLAVVGTSLGGLYVYEREGLVDYSLGTLMLTATVLGSIAGVLAAEAAGGGLMKAALAVVLAYTGATMMRRALKGATAAGSGAGHARLPLGWLASITAGIASSLAGIGGGVLIVPILNRIVGVDIKKAVATSKMMVGVTAASGAIGYMLIGYLNPCLGLALLAGTLMGGLAGSLVGVRLSGRTVLLLFSGFLLVMSVVVLVRG